MYDFITVCPTEKDYAQACGELLEEQEEWTVCPPRWYW